MTIRKIVNEEIKLIDQLVNLMIMLWFFLSSFALWFSLVRSELIGWTIREYVHIGTYILIITVGIFRNHIRPYTKAIVFIGFQLLIAVIGVLSFGIMAPAIFFFPLVCVMLALFFKQNVVVTFAVLILVFVALTGYAFQSGNLLLAVDADELFVSSEHWFLYIVSFTILVLFVAIAIIKYRNRVHHLFVEINRQKNAMKRLAHHDYLTGLPLVQLMMEKFDSTCANFSAEAHNLALVFLDLDDFKKVNDIHGHDAGDICLIHTAKSLKKHSGFRDYACRLAGDEFLLLIAQVQDEKQIVKRVSRVLQAINKPFMVEGKQLSIQISAGVAYYNQHGHKFSELKRAADLAMYQAKQDEGTSLRIAE